MLKLLFVRQRIIVRQAKQLDKAIRQDKKTRK